MNPSHLSHYISSANIEPPTYSSTIRAHKGTEREPMPNSERREIGHLAVWTLSSAKQGNGVHQLRDGNTTTFWQSDGQQPHFINIKFHRKLKVQEVCFYLDSNTDESYTPSKIAIRAANAFGDMVDIKTIEFDQPVGWFSFILDHKSGNQDIINHFVNTTEIQICILANQHSGRDTHIRQIKVFSPRSLNTLQLFKPNFIGVQYTSQLVLH